jgi:ParB family chromosome partitioning protein
MIYAIIGLRGMDNGIEAKVGHGEMAQPSSEPGAVRAPNEQKRIMRVAVDKVTPRRININYLDTEGYSALREDMKANGQRIPAEVRQVGADAYELVDGEHRWRAAMELGWREIEVIVTAMSDDQADVANFVLNAARGRMSPVRAAMLFDEDRRKGRSEAEIGEKYGCSQQRVSLYLETLTYPVEIQRLLTNQLVNFTMAHAKAIVKGIKDPDLQLQVANKTIAEGLSVREVESEIGSLLEEGRRREERKRRRATMFSSLDFALRFGEWKAAECRHKDGDGYCSARWWPEEPVELGEGLPWFEVDEFDGHWFAKASPEFCAFCEKFAREVDEVTSNRANAFALIALFYGLARKEACIHQTEGHCEGWQWLRTLCGESTDEFDEKRFKDLSTHFCALCHDFKSR